MTVRVMSVVVRVMSVSVVRGTVTESGQALGWGVRDRRPFGVEEENKHIQAVTFPSNKERFETRTCLA